MSKNNINFNVMEKDESIFTQENISMNGASRIQEAVVDTNVSLTDKIREYVKTYNPTIYLLTPCFASLCYVNYVFCLMQTVEACREFNINLKIEFCRNDSLVSRARNNLVARAMADPKMTHIIFIDNDISWDPADILKLMIANKPLIGGIYPLKHYYFDKLVKDPQNPYNSNVVQSWVAKKNQSQFKNFITDEKMVQYNLLKYKKEY
jgi:hypothetical protein